MGSCRSSIHRTQWVLLWCWGWWFCFPSLSFSIFCRGGYMMAMFFFLSCVRERTSFMTCIREWILVNYFMSVLCGIKQSFASEEVPRRGPDICTGFIDRFFPSMSGTNRILRISAANGQRLWENNGRKEIQPDPVTIDVKQSSRNPVTGRILYKNPPHPSILRFSLVAFFCPAGHGWSWSVFLRQHQPPDSSSNNSRHAGVSLAAIEQEEPLWEYYLQTQPVSGQRSAAANISSSVHSSLPASWFEVHHVRDLPCRQTDDWLFPATISFVTRSVSEFSRLCLSILRGDRFSHPDIVLFNGPRGVWRKADPSLQRYNLYGVRVRGLTPLLWSIIVVQRIDEIWSHPKNRWYLFQSSTSFWAPFFCPVTTRVIFLTLLISPQLKLIYNYMIGQSFTVLLYFSLFLWLVMFFYFAHTHKI